MTKVIDVAKVVLSSGAHAPPNGAFEACVMELSSYLAGEPWSDHPACVSPVLGEFLRSWNDSLDNKTRQKLKPYAARVIGTSGDGKDDQRAWMAVDWLARIYLPVWLDTAGLSDHAAAVRALIALDGAGAAKVAQPTLDAAGAAAWHAARYAAGAAARYAAGAAAGEALKPAVLTLQHSAFELLDRMLAL